MVAKDYYSEYENLYSEVVTACECIASHKSSLLSSEVGDINAMLSKLTIRENWQDKLGASFSEVIEKCSSAFKNIISSIDTTFAQGEENYNLLKTTLENLKKANEKYRDEVRMEPHLETSKYKIEQTTPDGQISITYDHSRFKSDYVNWKGRVTSYRTNCERLKLQVEVILIKLSSLTLNGEANFSSQASLSGTNVSNLFDIPLALPTDTDRSWVLSLYSGSLDPSELCYAQGNYRYITLGGGRNLAKSGCGFVSATMCLSCALTDAYGSNVNINPEQYAKALEEGTGHSIGRYFNENYDYAWNIYNDTTAVFNDVSVIHVKGSGGRVFNDENLPSVLESGGCVQVSLLNRNHIVAVSKYNSESGTYCLLNPERSEASNIEITTPIVRRDGVKGTIEGKNNPCIWTANNRLSIDFTTGEVTGIDVAGLSVTDYTINGHTYAAHTSEDGHSFFIDDVDALAEDLNSGSNGADTVSV